MVRMGHLRGKKSGLTVCKSSVHNNLKKAFGTQNIQKILQKKQLKYSSICKEISRFV